MKGVIFGGVLGLNTLCKGCSSHMTLVGLLYPGGDKSETVCTGYKVQPTKGLNLLKESECCALVQIVLCIPFLYINNIQKYYSVSLCVISSIIVFAPTLIFLIMIPSNIISNVLIGKFPSLIYSFSLHPNPPLVYFKAFLGTLFPSKFC